MNTINGSLLKGLFLYAADSSIAIYPGQWSNWNRRQKFQMVIYHYSKISKLQLQQKGFLKKLFSPTLKYNISGDYRQFRVFTKSLR